MKHLMILLVMIVLTGCATIPDPSRIGSAAWYDQRVKEIDQSFVDGQITREEQLTLRTEADKLRLIYQQQQDNDFRRSGYPYGRPLYDCNAGVCTPIYP